MVKVKCPAPNCTYGTDDIAPEAVATMMQLHAGHHAQSTQVVAKPGKVKRPVVTLAGSNEDWQYFTTRWSEYKSATKIAEDDIVLQLLECCDESLRRDLTRNAGGSMSTQSEETVLKAIKHLAVITENNMVSRIRLYNMQQDHGETVRSFCARLRGLANVCDFKVACPGDDCDIMVDFTDIMLRDTLVRGISDIDIQSDLLGDRNQNMTLAEVIRFVEAKEAGKHSSALFSSTSSTAAARSTYQRQKQEKSNRQQKRTIDPTAKCGHCGDTGHGEWASKSVRRDVCKAFLHTCKYCRNKGHFDKMCRSKPGDDQAHNEGAVYDMLCMVDTKHQRKRQPLRSSRNSTPMKLAHHVFNDIQDCWERRNSDPQPSISLTLQLDSDAYTSLGYKPPSITKSVTYSAIADTDCQSCLGGLQLIQSLGLSQNQLIPVDMKMRTAINSNINILGAVFVRITGIRPTSTHTRQMIYITDCTDKLYLNKSACRALGMIPESFPWLTIVT